MPSPAVTKAAIQRVIEAALAAGLTLGAVSVSKDGTVRVETRSAKEVDTVDMGGQAATPKKWAKR